MIGKHFLHTGDPRLAAHLANATDNESIEVETFGLSATTIAEAMAELRLMAAGCRTKWPFFHITVSPSIPYMQEGWDAYISSAAGEFHLEGFPYLFVRHLKYGKGGRTAEHGHLYFLRIDENGKAVPISYPKIRLEKLSRISEYRTGERFVSGDYNQSVIKYLLVEGHEDVAAAMLAVGLDQVQAPAATSSAERAMTERLGDWSVDEIDRRTYDAWRRSDTGPALMAALADVGLRLAIGKKCPVVVGPAGAKRSLLRAINAGGAKAANGKWLKKAVVVELLKGMDLPDANDLEPIPGFDAGCFGITGLERSVSARDVEAIPVEDELPADLPDVLDPQEELAVSTPDEQPRAELTPEQLQALLELEDALLGDAAAQAAKICSEIGARVQREIAEERRRLKARIVEEEEALDRPSIGVPNWRKRYRAKLANLPEDVGDLLAWVDRIDADRQRLRLTSGAEVVLTPDHATADHATEDTVAVMIAHARARRWKTITVSGGTAAWQQALARASVRAGITVVNAHLAPVARDEQKLMRQDGLVDRWRAVRAELEAVGPAGVDAEWRRKALGLFAELAVQPGIERRLEDEEDRTSLLEDVEAYRRVVERRQSPFEVPRAPSGP